MVTFSLPSLCPKPESLWTCSEKQKNCHRLDAALDTARTADFNRTNESRKREEKARRAIDTIALGEALKSSKIETVSPWEEPAGLESDSANDDTTKVTFFSWITASFSLTWRPSSVPWIYLELIWRQALDRSRITGPPSTSFYIKKFLTWYHI